MSNTQEENDRLADNVPGFDGIFLGYLIVFGVLSIFFLLYFNRAFGSLVSWGIRTWSWHRYKVYIDIQALQVSLLGGRIFFTGLRYHGNNESFYARYGYVTWRYWIWRVRDADIKNTKKKSRQQQQQGGEDTKSPPGKTLKHELPCRITVTVAGLEWFVYNRSPVYDSILAGLTEDASQADSGNSTSTEEKSGAALRHRHSRLSEKPLKPLDSRNDNQAALAKDPAIPGIAGHDAPPSSSSGQTVSTATSEEPSPVESSFNLPVLLQMFPISVSCTKAALVMGNDNTKAILVVKSDSLMGEIDASETTTPDPYRQIFNIKFEHPVIEMKENEDFKEDQVARATKDKDDDAPALHKGGFFRRQRRRALGGLRNLVPSWRKSVESFHLDARSAHTAHLPHIPGNGQWQGLARYLDDNEQDSKTRWANVDYAAITTLIDSPEATLVVYWDSPAKVPAESPQTAVSGRSYPQHHFINGAEPPAWGIKLSVKGGSANYGPWSDRQRADLQRVFFPGLSKDAVPAKPLSKGEYRLSTQFKLYVELEEELTLRIPTKEDSKNWRWKGKEPTTKAEPRVHRTRKQRARAKKHNKGDAVPLRPAGWLDLKVAANTTVSYCMDSYAGPDGFAMKLDLDLPSTELTSSVNHELLWRSGALRVTCDLSTPLKWNGLRTWYFNVNASDMDLFILRDHIFLLIDLVDDWSSGPPAEYLVFTPFRYILNLDLRNLKLFLNVNDGNIINKPTDFDDNAYIIASSPALVSKVTIPIDQYRPSKNTISFESKAETYDFAVHVPPWNTQASFVDSESFGQGENFALHGGYTYNATTSAANTDTLTLDLLAQSPSATLHGFIIRYFLKLKDNYFGDDIHFKTLDEYREAKELKEKDPAADQASRPPPKKSNDLDVILNIRVDDPRILLPANLYSSRRHVQIETASLAADLRFTSYYMDLDLVLAPLNISLGGGNTGLETPVSATSGTQLFVDGLKIYGHRLFGLPPSEPTYMCNWDLCIGAVTGECTAEFLSAFAMGGRVFGFEFDDDENALIPYSSIIMYDVTFLRLAVGSVRVWLHVDEAAFLLSTGDIDIEFNDWARSHYSKRADVHIPNLELSCINSEAIARQRSRTHHDVEPEVFVRTTIHLASIGRKFHFSEERKLQQGLIRREDQRTNRTEFLLLPDVVDDFVPEATDPPAQGAPSVPHPAELELNAGEWSSRASSVSRTFSGRRLRHKSSFLSTSTGGSSCSSIRRSKSRPRNVNSRPAPESGRQGGLLQPGRSAAPGNASARDASTSTGRHSFIHPLGQNDPGGRDHLSHMAFSSQFHPPYFPLENVEPMDAGSRAPSIDVWDKDDNAVPVSFGLEDIDPSTLSEDHAYSSVLVELPTGISACFTSTSVKYVTSLLEAFQPSHPDDILDDLQIDSIGVIFAKQAAAKVDGKISDLLLKIPKASVRFLGASADAIDTTPEEQDQYDVVLSDLALSTRSTSNHAINPHQEPDNHGQKERLSLMLRLASAEISASERSKGISGTQAAVMANIEKVMVSIGSKDVTYVDGEIGSARMTAASDKVEYLASLVHRTESLVSELGGLVDETLSRHDRRLKHFAYSLLHEGNGTADPTFLVRPSAVLRSANQHLRIQDTWKLCVHLRQIWATLPQDSREQLLMDCWTGSTSPVAHTRERTIEAFREWRTWDLDDISADPLIVKIFGETPADPNNEGLERPLMAAFRLTDAQVVLDPGPKQNRIALGDLSLRLEKKLNHKDSGLAEDAMATNLFIVNVFCGEAAVNLNWELCELLEDVLQLSVRDPDPKTPPLPRNTETSPVSSSKPKIPTNVHVVTTLGTGVIDLESINLRVKTLCDDFKASVLTQSQESGGTYLNFVLGSNAVTTKLHHRSELLGMFQLEGPSVFISHELHEMDTTACHTIKTTASSRNLALTVKQDPIGLLEVANVFVRDELSQVHQLVNKLPSSVSKANQGKSISTQLSSFRVNVAMFLDQYHISIPLLQSLTYNISGVVARAAVAANFGKELIFDFDIKENSHEMQINVKNQPRGISLLQIPPTNGRVISRMGSTEHSITVFASVEPIKLEVSAVYSLLRALNRPQISSALNEIQDQVSVIQEHANEIFGISNDTRSERTKSPEASRKLVYLVHVTLAGLQIFGKTPLKSGSDDAAYISFNLHRVHLEIANRHGRRGPILTQPELHINLRRILFEIEKEAKATTRSCGKIELGALISATTRLTESGKEERSFNFGSDGLDIQLSPETISTVMEVVGYMSDKIKDIDTSREVEYLRKIRQTRPRIALNDEETPEEPDIIDQFLSSLVYKFEVRDTRVSWLVSEAMNAPPSAEQENLVLSIELISLGTRQTGSARLLIENFQLQMVQPGQDLLIRSPHSALLPEVVFNIAYVSTSTTRRLAFQAVGKSLDLRLTSGFIIPAAHLGDSINTSVKNVREAAELWATVESKIKIGGENEQPQPQPEPSEEHSITRRPSLLGSKRIESFLVDADFAGAVVQISPKRPVGNSRGISRNMRQATSGKYGQFNPDESGSGTVLRSPGLAWKVEYRDNGKEDPSLYGEIKIDASSNTLYPAVVPLIMEITSSVKQVVSDGSEHENNQTPKIEASPETAAESEGEAKAKHSTEENILTADPNAVLGRLKLNIGLRICRQEFSLSCQPIARVAATACFDDIYFTANTVRSAEQGNFFAISGAFTNLQMSVQHVYSRESTGSFELDSIGLSLMNSKHVSGTSGVSAILKVSPMNMAINAKQLQDFLLFREIWYPKELRQGSAAPVATLATETSQGHLVQRYQQVAATAAFPWTATISIESLDVSVDLGQAIGKSVFAINDFWVSSKKTSDWEQNLCLGFDKIGIDCTGRLSGFIALQDFRLRTSIQWPDREAALNETPAIQASIGFSQFRLKAAFDYQAFLVADITSLEFLMYNVRRQMGGTGDRLVAIFDGEAVQIFGITSSASQAIALWQAIQKLIQERRANFETSLKEIEKFMRRRSQNVTPTTSQAPPTPKLPEDEGTLSKSPISLDTDVVVTLKALNLGVFPNTFSDHQVFKMEALNAQARFVASMENRKIHSILDLTLGQLRIGLAGVRHTEAPKTLSEMSVEDVVERATGSRGGTILKVPRLEMVMQTWQKPNTNRIDYKFKSAFEGKVEVGWNYSRISYIRGMFAKHLKALEQIWGRELPLTAIKVTGVPEAERDDDEDRGQMVRKDSSDEEQQKQQKITAEVNVPQSKYDYVALEPAIIETPQLRDMGEATPPLEWIGLHRDRLPNLTHQIVIVSLLELAGEVEDAYERILGSS